MALSGPREKSLDQGSRGKQAKILNEHQLQALLAQLDTRKHAERNELIVLLSDKAGLRAKEIASLKWSMVMSADGEIGDHIQLTNEASKGRSGRVFALNTELRKQPIKVKERRFSRFPWMEDRRLN